MINYRIFIFGILFIFFGCHKNTEFEVIANLPFLEYKDSNTLEQPLFKRFENDYKRRYQVDRKIRNDTTFLIIKQDNEIVFGFPPWQYEQKLYPAPLDCDEQIKINTGRLAFYFCYAESLEYIHKLATKNDEAYYWYFSEIEKLLLNLKNKKAPTIPDIVGERVISELLLHLNFDVKDAGGDTIKIVTIGKIYSGWSSDYDHHFINMENDTIAAFSCNLWMQ